MLLSKATYNWGIHKAINLEEANRQITPSLRHCSNKYKLTREGEKDKKRDEDLEKVIKKKKLNLMMKLSRVERDEFSVVA